MRVRLGEEEAEFRLKDATAMKDDAIVSLFQLHHTFFVPFLCNGSGNSTSYLLTSQELFSIT